MNTLNLSSLDFCSKDQSLRITISWDKGTLQNLSSSKELNITEIKAYELSNKQLKFAKKYHLPFKHTYYSIEEINSCINLIEGYQILVDLAAALKFDFNWDFSNFDYKELKRAIDEELLERTKKQ